MKQLLISLHLPKTGGNSFLNAIQSRIGQGCVQDYMDMNYIQAYFMGGVPGNAIRKIQAEDIDPRVRCIHGHFLPAKYLELKQMQGIKFITWLCNPVDRLVSHYYFFLRSYDPNTAGPLFRKVIEEEWTLEKFCFLNEYKNIYAKYLVGFSFDYFDFVGLIEFYDEDLNYFSNKFLKTRLDALKLNCADSDELGGKHIDADFRKEVEKFHCQDMELYNLVLKQRESRV